MNAAERARPRSRTVELLRTGAIVVGIVGAGAGVFASVPHAFKDGDTLTAEKLTGNFGALDQRIIALEAQVAALRAPLVWANADLLNNWTAYDTTWPGPAYAKDAQGIVHMRGLVKRASTPANIAVLVLPPGFRPKMQLEAPLACAGSIPCEVVMRTTGETFFETGDIGWVSFDGLTFEAAP